MWRQIPECDDVLLIQQQQQQQHIALAQLLHACGDANSSFHYQL
jgi:hypothetical protein